MSRYTTRALAASAVLSATGEGTGGFTTTGRFLGRRTTAGPPTTGTFAVGDWGLDSDGRMWSCTVAGTPGTWIDLSSGRELPNGYAEITTTFTGTSTSLADVTGLSITPTVGTRPIKLIVDAQAFRNATANTSGQLTIIAGAATQLGTTQFGGAAYPAATNMSCHREVIVRSPVAATTYKVQYLVTAGTIAVVAAATTPAFIQAVEC